MLCHFFCKYYNTYICILHNHHIELLGGEIIGDAKSYKRANTTNETSQTQLKGYLTLWPNRVTTDVCDAQDPKDFFFPQAEIVIQGTVKKKMILLSLRISSIWFSYTCKI